MAAGEALDGKEKGESVKVSIMMINKRLIGTVSESKKYIVGNVAAQWCSLAANIVMMTAVTGLLASLYDKTADKRSVFITVSVAASAVVLRFICAVFSSRMGYLSSKSVDLRQYFGQRKSKDYAVFLSSSSSFCCGVK